MDRTDLTYHIDILDDTAGTGYEALLLSEGSSLFYVSPAYIKLITAHLNAEPYYVVATGEGGEVYGALPFIIIPNETYGPVANSLPFFGSNGGPVVLASLHDREKDLVRGQLMDAAMQLIRSKGCVAVTFITNPLDPGAHEWMDRHFPATYTDSRIGQITELPEAGGEEELMKIFEDPRPRNIRKAIKSGVNCYVSHAAEDMDFLYRVHYDNITSIGGQTKRKDFFTAIDRSIDRDQYNLYIAQKDGRKIAALLLFYYNKTVEYFTPATIHEFRNIQPSSLLIFEAMQHAAAQGYRYWNWGGTWQSQTGVYGFKKKWGAKDFPYFYHTLILDDKVLALSPEALVREYPFTYVFPFGR